ncbi:MAG TPA: M13 family metallopeptidase N-terminal domain-containing protein, partial [Xanthomonadales bacterium]|nr:M13 family metallopeptidase N-terminal domain-containing protein [Xanthomonadales bacterium]
MRIAIQSALLLGAVLLSLSVTAAEQATTSLPYTPSLDVTAMDRSANPCDNLYQYSCGGWIKNNPIPADQASWSTYGKLYVDNQRYLWGILQELASNTDQRSAGQAQLGDYFAACMNVDAIDQAGTSPLQAELAAIEQLQDRAGLAGLV